LLEIKSVVEIKLDYNSRVEFVGLSGAGKSTLCSKLAEDAVETKNPSYVYPRKITTKTNKKWFYYLRWLKLKPTTFLFSISAGFNLIHSLNYSYESIRKFHHLLLEYAKIIEFMNKNSEGLKIYDQGTLQAFCSIFVLRPANYKKYVEKLLNNLMYLMPEKIVYLRASPKLANERIEKRGGESSRLDRLEEGKRLKELGKFRDVIEIAINCLAARENLTVVELDATKSPKTLVAKIQESNLLDLED